MKAVQFNVTIPRYVAGIAVRGWAPALLWRGLSCTALVDVPEPSLPAPDWVLVRTRYGGICGSDLHTVYLESSPYYTPLTSFPLILGHENMGVVAAVGAEASGWEPGTRVVVEPLLWCRPRGFTNPCRQCAAGHINQCERVREGTLAPGLFTGACASTGGSWSPYFAAHTSQLYRLPDNVSDENGLMVEPFACGLHAALKDFPAPHERVVIVGAGTIGLCTLAALRTLGSEAEIIVIARHPFQAEAAKRLGASDVILSRREESYYREVARRTGADVVRPIIGKEIVLGGADCVFECTGSSAALDDALRLARSQGRVILVGAVGQVKGVDWSSIFLQELDLKAAFTYDHAEEIAGRRWTTFELAIELMAQNQVDLSWLITHQFPLEKYDRALRFASDRKSHGLIKAVFAF